MVDTDDQNPSLVQCLKVGGFGLGKVNDDGETSFGPSLGNGVFRILLRSGDQILGNPFVATLF